MEYWYDEAISDIIDSIETLAPDTVKGLWALWDDFQIGQIRDLLKDAGKNESKQ